MDCGRIRPLSEFIPSPKYKLGYKPRCRDCNGIYQRRYWETCREEPKRLISQKHCADCHQIKSISEFYRDTARRDGLMWICKTCTNARGRSYRATHRFVPARLSSKRCPRCRTEKPISAFRFSPFNKDGYAGWCIDCERENLTLRRKNMPNENRTAQKKTRYGVTEAIYLEMLKSQNGVCAICGKSETRKASNGQIRPLSVDHCHTTQLIRGLLCDSCNNGIARFHDDPDLLIRAAEYLRRARA